MCASSYLRLCVYPQDPFGGRISRLPGEELENLITLSGVISGVDPSLLERKLHQSCRKLCLMWYAGDLAIEAERDFYSTTFQDAPALIGEEAIRVYYHLEALVLFARSALDVASTIFGWTLPDPFPRRRFDSFNSLVKEMLKETQHIEISEFFSNLRENNLNWLSIISGVQRGRSLRDKISHQTEFPIDYLELNPPSEKESPVVWIGEEFLPLVEFVDELRMGVICGYLEIEKPCCQYLTNLNKISP